MAITVDFAPGFGPLDATPAWVALTDRLLEATWDEGRSNELEHYGPGQGTVVLKNDDRELDPFNAAGTWAGQLNPRTPFRIREDGADRFYGFVEAGFDQTITPPASAACTVTLVDRLTAVAGTLPDVFEHALLQAQPAGLWVLDGPSGSEEVADLSGNGNDGAVQGAVQFGSTPVTSGHNASALFDSDATQFGRVEISRGQILDPAHATVVAAVRVGDLSTVTNFGVVFMQGDGNVVPPASFARRFGMAVDSDGFPVWFVRTPAVAFTGKHSTVRVNDGSGHLLIAQSNEGGLSNFGIAVDSATLDETSEIIGPPIVNGVGIAGHKGVQGPDHFDGWIGSVAVYDDTLTLSQREAILEGYTKLSGQRSDQQIAWALERIGVPAALMNLEQGTTLMGPAATKGTDALQFIREVVSTEQGEFYCDHRDGGKLRFRGRYARLTASRSTTSQASFSDDPNDVNAVRYERSGLDVAPNGIDSIVNQAVVRWRGGELSVGAAVAGGGPRQRRVETQATTAAQARSAGEWLVANRKDPQSRVKGLSTRPDVSAAALAAAQALHVGDRVTFRLHPQEVGAPIEVDLFIEGISQSCSDGVHRSASYKFSTADTFAPWIWGVSQWDIETAWG